MKLGARTIKTGLAVAVAIIIADLIPVIQVTMPAFTVVLAMQQSVGKTWQTMVQRFLAALLGGLTAVIMYHFFGNNPAVVGFATIIFILILNALKLTSVIPLATITVVIIMLSTYENGGPESIIIHSAIMRVIESILGVFIAFVINTFIMPPNYNTMLYDAINTTNTEVLIRLRAILRKNGEYSTLNSDIAWMHRRQVHIHDLYDLLRDEYMWWRVRGITEFKRKLVVFRAFQDVLNQATRLLSILHEHTNVIFEIPDHLRLEIRERVETLCAAHEQIFLKFDGRIAPTEVNFFKSSANYRQKLMEDIFSAARLPQGEVASEDTDWELERSNALLLIASAIIRYEKSLIHLNMLVRSYRIYHGEDKFRGDSLQGRG